MSTTIADPPEPKASPQGMARLIGAFSLCTVLGGMFAQGYVSDRLIVWGDAAATATNILAHRSLYLSGLTVYLVEMACSVVTTALFYLLLRPAGRSVSLVAACLGLVACTTKIVGRIFFAAPLYVLGGLYPFHALGPRTQDELALLLLLINDHAAGIAMAFFGIYALLAGFLILRSTFLPRLLGVLSILGGLGWLTHLWPPLGYRLGDLLLVFALLGSIVKISWLLVFGVNEARWREQARSSRW